MTAPEDPYAWLEDVDGEAALDWVRARNAESAAALTGTELFARTRNRIRSILDSDDKIPYLGRRGAHYYNFWTDAEHERGLWRRTDLDSYRRGEPQWETVLDLDALAAAEGESWVWHGPTVWRGRPGEPDAFRRAMLHLSRGGSDADVSREFDLVSKTFVENGFHRPESKGGLSWQDQDTLLVHTDFGEGSMTASGYPRIVKRWHRGTPLAEATTLFEGRAEDMSVGAWHDGTPGFERTFVVQQLSFWTSRLFLLGPDDGPILIEVPESAITEVRREWMTLELREDWAIAGVVHPAGALLAIRFEDFLAGDRDLATLYSPTPTSSLAGASWTRNHLVLNVLEDVVNRLEILTPPATGRADSAEAGFRRRPVTGLPAVGTIGLTPVDSRDSDEVWLVTSGFLDPTTLSLSRIEDDGALGEIERLRSSPRWFDATGLVAEQHFVTSADGTRVPYFLVRREPLARPGTQTWTGSAATGPEPHDDPGPTGGGAPTLLHGYGGFEIAMTPGYSGSLGAAWLERGGTYAVANIRGGGEYGPRWHQAALRENRHRAYEDMAAVARDLVGRGITTPAQLAVQGGSNGGLMAGNMLVRHPESFGAVVIEVPLLDMRRYSHLLAGASWVAEYGDPDDPEDWQFLRTLSPYHLIDAGLEAGTTYPPVLFTTSTRDDRVHPAHARKMAAKMLAAGQDVTYYENIEGGHGGAATNEQAAHRSALAYTFLATRLGLL